MKYKYLIKSCLAVFCTLPLKKSNFKTNLELTAYVIIY